MKAIVVQNLNLTRAELIIALKSDTSSMAKVLEELIKVANDKGFIEQSTTLYDHINKTIDITNVNYRAIIHKLTKLNIIEKQNRGYQLCKELSGPQDKAFAICELSYIQKS